MCTIKCKVRSIPVQRYVVEEQNQQAVTLHLTGLQCDRLVFFSARFTDSDKTNCRLIFFGKIHSSLSYKNILKNKFLCFSCNIRTASKRKLRKWKMFRNIGRIKMQTRKKKQQPPCKKQFIYLNRYILFLRNDFFLDFIQFYLSLSI